MTKSQIDNEINYFVLHCIVLELFNEKVLTKDEYELLNGELLKEIKPLYFSLLT